MYAQQGYAFCCVRLYVCIFVYIYVNKKNRLFSALPLGNLLNVIYCLFFKFKWLQCGLLRPASCTDRVINAFPNKTCRPPLAPKYFLQSFNGTPHSLVRLELAKLAEELAAVIPFVSWSECFRMIIRLSVLVSATTATHCYLYMYAADGILGSASVRLVYSR